MTLHHLSSHQFIICGRLISEWKNDPLKKKTNKNKQKACPIPVYPKLASEKEQVAPEITKYKYHGKK